MTKPLNEMTVTELIARDAEIGNQLDSMDFTRNQGTSFAVQKKIDEMATGKLRERREVRARLEQLNARTYRLVGGKLDISLT